MSGPDTLKREHQHKAFTIIELLVVIAIIGALTAISLPAIKGISQAHTLSSASRQLLDDIGLARQYAIHNRAVVHVLFVPPVITNIFPIAANTPELPKRLMSGIYSSYAIYAERTVGDQPGQPRPRYLSKWKRLPEGVFIAPREFEDLDFRLWDDVGTTPIGRPFLWDTLTDFPFPTLTNNRVRLPHIAFNPNGGIMVEDDVGQRHMSRDEVIELARGSILSARDNSGNLIYFDVRESPPNNSIDNYNRIRIDGLTGRATLERPEIVPPPSQVP
jgi:prepilin-type N-terminal cleavage/methylation domain-containing protein